MKPIITRAQFEKAWEETRLRLIAKGEIPEKEIDSEQIAQKLSCATDSSDMIRILEEIDPVNYRMYYVFSNEHKYLGLIIKIKFEKNEDVIRFPSGDNEVFNVVKVADSNPHRKSFMFMDDANIKYYVNSRTSVS